MNFLLHRHLAARDLGSGAAGAGAMLPDLWRMADRRVRPARDGAPAHGAAAGGVLGEVLDGVAHHVAADRWFHGAPVFLDGERRAAAALREAAARGGAAAGPPRLALFAHVLWEMCLDGALVRREGLGAVLGATRAGLSAIERSAAGARAAALHHFERAERTADERAAFETRMRRLREEIARGPWIEGYQDGEGVAIRLAGVRSRFGLPPFSPGELAAVAAAIDGLAAEADRAVAAILAAPGAALTETAPTGSSSAPARDRP